MTPNRRTARLSAFIILLLLGVGAQAQTANKLAHPEIAFKVSMTRPFTHLLEVEMRLKQDRAFGGQTDVVMPVWTPGSYLVREYARHVQDFQANDAAGAALGWAKTNKNTWRIDAKGAKEIVVKYSLYANELTVRTNELNDRHAFFTPAALLMYPDGHVSAPSTIQVVPFGDWQVATGLPSIDGKANTFRSENFDVLFDSPFEVGPFKTITFDVRGVPHRIVIEGDGNYDADRMRDDVKKIVEASIALMGGDIPYRDYLFILNLPANGGGGLEHLNSTALIASKFGLRPGSPGYQNFLNLVAHEFFHLWNVKRIKPDALGPFDYTRENYTKLLWVAEGFTSYYATLLVRRAGLMSEREFLTTLASNIEALQRQPGRLEMSVEEASFDAWIKYYRRDENDVNSQISYYDKGELLGFMLDLEIRKRSAGAKSMDDVMRHLYTEFSKKGKNFSPDDFQKVCELMAGSSLADFFSRFVRGRDELDYAAALAHAGLRLEATGTTNRAFFGADMSQTGDRLMVTKVYAGTPAYEQEINANDQIVAIGGNRASLSFFNARLSELKPGDTIRLSFFRNDELRTIEVKLGGQPDSQFRITPLLAPTEEQKRINLAWIGLPG